MLKDEQLKVHPRPTITAFLLRLITRLILLAQAPQAPRAPEYQKRHIRVLHNRPADRRVLSKGQIANPVRLRRGRVVVQRGRLRAERALSLRLRRVHIAHITHEPAVRVAPAKFLDPEPVLAQLDRGVLVDDRHQAHLLAIVLMLDLKASFMRQPEQNNHR